MAAAKNAEKRVPILTGIGGSIIITIMIMLLSRVGLLYELELKTYDSRFLWRGPIPVDSSQVVIVAVDDESFLTLPDRWPFPRYYFAHMLENLFRAGARMVIFDIEFTEPMNPEQDSLLAAVTGKYADRVIHAGKIAFIRKRNVEGLITQAHRPIDQIEATGSHIGIVNEIKDRDGFTRRYKLFEEHGDLMYLPLSMKALQVINEMADTSIFNLSNPHKTLFGPYKIPMMTTTTFLINFYGPAGHFPTYSLASVLDDSTFKLKEDDTNYMDMYLAMSDDMIDQKLNETYSAPEYQAMDPTVLEMIKSTAREALRGVRENSPFRNKVVFIGASAAELQDNKNTPFYSYAPPGESSWNQQTPGVEVHANAFQTIVDQNFIVNADEILEWLLVFILALAVFFINNYTRILPGSMMTMGMLLGVIVGIYYIFIAEQIWVALVAPVLVIGFMYLFTTAYRIITAQKEKAMIKGMFSQYVPQKVVASLIDNPDMLKLGGERRRMTALFTDVAGFTSVSEKLTPEELVHLLNEYLSEMSRIILENEGIIDKYEGDLIMAEWGAPVYFEDHAAWGCRAALRMQKRLVELREVWKEKGEPVLYSRVGVNTGDMIVGNMGCLEVFDYTVMGDAVNLASRLEGANKGYGSTIMIGPETYEDIKDKGFVTRMLDDIRVKGKETGVRVYELIAEDESEVSAEKKQVIELYLKGLELYRDMQFTDAKQKFEAALEIDPDDGPSKTYLGRCEQYVIDPPEPDWDRIFTFTEK